MPMYVEVDRWTLSEELWLYGEDDLYLKPLEMSDAELLEVYRLAGEIYMKGKARSGAEAAALAAVALAEGRERRLARKRRRPRSNLPAHAVPSDARLDDMRRISALRFGDVTRPEQPRVRG